LAQGHEVDWRPVEPAEAELSSSYDVALVGLHCFGALASEYKFGALWTMTQMPHLPILQDWRVAKVVQQFDNDEYLWRCQHIDRDSFMRRYFAAMRHGELIENLRRILRRQFNKVLIPLEDWGDANALRKRHPANIIYPWNPDPFFPTHEIYRGNAVPTRRREWTCASLSDQREWIKSLGLEWPVHMIQNMETRLKGGASKWRAKPETEVFTEHYSQEWGCLLPYYGRENEVPGWWRGRYKISYEAGTVLYADQRECSLPSYCIHSEWLEHASTQELSDTAARQRAELEKHWLTKEQSGQQLTSYLEEPCDPVTL